MLALWSSTESLSDESVHETENHVCSCNLVDPKTTQSRLNSKHRRKNNNQCAPIRPTDTCETSSFKVSCSSDRNRSSRSSYLESTLATCLPTLCQTDPPELHEHLSKASRHSVISSKNSNGREPHKHTCSVTGVHTCSRRRVPSKPNYSNAFCQAKIRARQSDPVCDMTRPNSCTHGLPIKRGYRHMKSTSSNPSLSWTTSPTCGQNPVARKHVKPVKCISNIKPRWSYAGPNKPGPDRRDCVRTANSDSSLSQSTRSYRAQSMSVDSLKNIRSLCSPRRIQHANRTNGPYNAITRLGLIDSKRDSPFRRSTYPLSSCDRGKPLPMKKPTTTPEFRRVMTTRKSAPKPLPVRVILTPKSRVQALLERSTLPPPPAKPTPPSMPHCVESRSTQTSTANKVAVSNHYCSLPPKTPRGALQVAGDQSIDVRVKPIRQRWSDIPVVRTVQTDRQSPGEDMSVYEDELSIPASVSKVNDPRLLAPIALSEDDRSTSESSMRTSIAKQQLLPDHQIQPTVHTACTVPFVNLSLNKTRTGSDVPVQINTSTPIVQIHEPHRDPFTIGDGNSESPAVVDAQISMNQDQPVVSWTAFSDERPPSRTGRKARSILRNSQPIMSMTATAESTVQFRNSSAPARLIIKAHSNQTMSPRSMGRLQRTNNRSKRAGTISPEVIRLNPNCITQVKLHHDASIACVQTPPGRLTARSNHSMESIGFCHPTTDKHHHHHHRHSATPELSRDFDPTSPSPDHVKSGFPGATRHGPIDPGAQATVVEASEDLLSFSERSVRTPDGVNKRLTSIVQPLVSSRGPKEQLGDSGCCCCAYHHDDW